MKQALIRKAFMLVAVVALAIGCKKDPSLWQTSNLNNNAISIVGHGGSGIKSRFPINSMQSLNAVLDKEVAGTEMDVQLSKDGELVLYHPQKLEDATSCDGSVRTKTWNELRECGYTPAIYTGREKLIRATDFFEQRNNVPAFLYVFDTKIPVDADSLYVNQFADALTALVEKYKLTGNCFVESYSLYFLKALHQRNKYLKLFIHANTLADALQVAEQVPLYGITMDRLYISQAEIARAHSKNLRVALFNLETETENLAGIAMGPDYLQTDLPDFLIEALR